MYLEIIRPANINKIGNKYFLSIAPVETRHCLVSTRFNIQKTKLVPISISKTFVGTPKRLNLTKYNGRQKTVRYIKFSKLAIFFIGVNISKTQS